jgi:hypothetical protein
VKRSQETSACFLPLVLNFTLGLACYAVIYMLSIILLIQNTSEATTAIILILAMGTLPAVTSIVRFICFKVVTGQRNVSCKHVRH